MLLVSSPESTAPRHSAVNEVQGSPPPCAAMRSDVSRFHRRHFTQDRMNTSQLTCSQPSSYPFWLPWKPAVVFSLLSAGWLVRDVRLLFLLAAWQNNPHSHESISSQTQRPGEETGKSWAGHRLSLIDCWTPPSQFADLTRCFHSNPHFPLVWMKQILYLQTAPLHLVWLLLGQPPRELSPLENFCVCTLSPDRQTHTQLRAIAGLVSHGAPCWADEGQCECLRRTKDWTAHHAVFPFVYFLITTYRR